MLPMMTKSRNGAFRSTESRVSAQSLKYLTRYHTTYYSTEHNINNNNHALILFGEFALIENRRPLIKIKIANQSKT